MGETPRSEFENAMKRYEAQHFIDLVRSMTHRLWWMMLLAVHVHPLISTMRFMILEGVTPARLFAFFGLILLIGFFVLKIANVPFLRHHARREALIVFWIIAALVHNNASTAALEAVSTQPAPVAVLVGFSIAGSGVSSHRNRKKVVRFLRRLHDSLIARVRITCTLFLHLVYEPVLRSRFYDRPCQCALRAPPVCDS